MEKERALRFDIIRIVAIIMILMIHVSVLLVLFTPDTASPSFISANIINGIGRAGVPMFLMLSGALLLDEKRKFDTKKFYKKPFLTIVFLLVFWLLFYATWRTFLLPTILGNEIDTALFGQYLLHLKGLYPHLWYLFMLVGAYLAIPFLRLFVKKENKPYILGFIIVAFIAQFATQTAGVFTQGSSFSISEFMSKFHLEYATGFLPYLLVGWYVTAFPPTKKHRLFIYAFGALALLSSILAVQFYIREIPAIHDYVMEANTLTSALYGLSVFTLICAIAKDRTTKSTLIRELSMSAFGVYILHVAVLDILTNKLMPFDSGWESIPVIYLLALILINYAVCLLIVIPLSRVKGVKKIFHY